MNCSIKSEIRWPDSMEALRVEDSVLGQGYESVAPAQRACIKTGIAFQYALHGEQPNRREECVDDHERGFVYRVVRRPAAWTLLLLGPGYAAAPRLVAALMPALLARVPLVGAACVGALPTAAACASLELMGIEDVFCFADAAKAQEALQQLTAHNPVSQGRVLLLHKGELADVAQAAQRNGLPSWQECRAPRIAVQPDGETELDLLQWGHPDAVWTVWPLGHECPVADAVFCTTPEPHEAKMGSTSSPLCLGTDAEGLWWHQGLETQFFLHKALSVACEVDTFTEESPV